MGIGTSAITIPHFNLHTESVRLVHLHGLPRTRALPTGNIPATLLGSWHSLLRRLCLRQAYSDDQVAQVATMLRATFVRLEL